MKQLKSSGKPYLRTNKAQSLLELAIFGSLLIMLLGVLINYGLRYNFQHQVSWRAFRQALYHAEYSAKDNRPSSVSTVMIKDIHIPDPSSPTGIGQIASVASSVTSPMRSHRLYENPENAQELNRMDIHVYDGEDRGWWNRPEGYSTQSFKTQAFRMERDINERQYAKYEEIYGASNVWWDDSEESQDYRECVQDQCWAVVWFNRTGTNKCDFFTGTGYAMQDLAPNPVGNSYYYCGHRDGTYHCTDCWEEWLAHTQTNYKNCTMGSFKEARENPPRETSGGFSQRCTQYKYPIYILDPTAGQIMDKDSLIKQCRMIVDRDFCVSECEKARMAGQTEAEELPYCQEICNEITNRPNYQVKQSGGMYRGGAWYCANWVRIPEGTGRYAHYDFPVIEEIFSGTYKAKTMGLSPDMLTTTKKAEVLSKEETLHQSKTDESVYLNQSIRREIHWLDRVSSDGYSFYGTSNPSTINYSYSNRTIDRELSQSTPKE